MAGHAGSESGPVMLPAEPGREAITAQHAAALAALQADARSREN
jgi:hypothetical protein